MAASTLRRFGVLATYDGPLLGVLLAALRKHGATPSALILDSQLMTEKDRRIHDERTKGEMPWIPLHQDAAGVPAYFVESHKDATTLAVTTALSLDFLINGGTPRILREPLLEATPLGVISCHPGRLPAYRGCTCPEWAVFNDDPICNTVHRMTAGIDEGPVLRIDPVTFATPCSYQDMRLAVYRQGMELLARVTGELQSGTLDASSFVEQGPGTYRHPIDDERMAIVRTKLESGSYSPAGMHQ
jgi:methionyl-tRNA formyltransferase